MAEHIALHFDWDEVEGSRITEILGQNARAMDDGSANWEAVMICTERKSILLTVEPDTDQIAVSLCDSPVGDGWERIHSFNFVRGQPLGWCWIGINSQGYKDSLTLAFGDVVPHALEPRCMFVAEGSSLACFDLTPRMA